MLTSTTKPSLSEPDFEALLAMLPHATDVQMEAENPQEIEELANVEESWRRPIPSSLNEEMHAAARRAADPVASHRHRGISIHNEDGVQGALDCRRRHFSDSSHELRNLYRGRTLRSEVISETDETAESQSEAVFTASTNTGPISTNVTSQQHSRRRTNSTRSVARRSSSPYQGRECRHCPKSFSTPSERRKHEEYHVPRDQRPRKCDKCGKRFVHQHILDRHITKHSDKRNFECDVCHKRFKRKDFIPRHKRKQHPATLVAFDGQRDVEGEEHDDVATDGQDTAAADIAAETVKPSPQMPLSAAGLFMYNAWSPAGILLASDPSAGHNIPHGSASSAAHSGNSFYVFDSKVNSSYPVPHTGGTIAQHSTIESSSPMENEHSIPRTLIDVPPSILPSAELIGISGATYHAMTFGNSADMPRLQYTIPSEFSHSIGDVTSDNNNNQSTHEENDWNPTLPLDLSWVDSALR